MPRLISQKNKTKQIKMSSAAFVISVLSIKVFKVIFIIHMHCGILFIFDQLVDIGPKFFYSTTIHPPEDHEFRTFMSHFYAKDLTPECLN